MKKENRFRSRKHAMMLYPEDATHVACLEKIKQTLEHVYILHDQDKNEDGEIKKPHWHVLIEYKNATWNTAAAQELGIPENYIQQVRNEEAALAYLIHFHEEEKHQYHITNVHGTKKLLKKLNKIIENETISEGEKALEILEMIENATGNISVLGFAKFAAAGDRWDVFRRAAGIFIKCIEEKKGLAKEDK